MRSLQELTPEQALNNQLWELSLPHRIDTLPKEDCRVGYLYWGDGDREVDIALCSGIDEYNDLLFQGVRETRGKYELFTERLPTDCGGSSKGWAPIVELENVPDFNSERIAVLWLLEKEIEVVELKIEWLMNLPETYRKATDYQFILERDVMKLEAMKDIMDSGPAVQSYITVTPKN